MLKSVPAESSANGQPRGTQISLLDNDIEGASTSQPGPPFFFSESLCLSCRGGCRGLSIARLATPVAVAFPVPRRHGEKRGGSGYVPIE